MAILCHPIHREKFLLFSQEDAFLTVMLDNLFSDLPDELSSCKYDDTDSFSTDGPREDYNQIVEFMEQAIATAVSFIKQVPYFEPLYGASTNSNRY